MYTAINAGNTTLTCRVNGTPMLKAIFSPVIQKNMIRGHATIMTIKSGDKITVTLDAGSLSSATVSFSAFYGFLLAPN